MNFVRKYSMMMLLLSGAMTIVSCSNDEEEFQANNRTRISITAANPALEADTRTTLDPSEQPLWDGFDEIKVFNNVFSNDSYSFVADGNSKDKTATFTLSEKDEDRWLRDFKADETEFYALVHGPRATRYEKTTNEIMLRHGISEDPSVDEFGQAEGPKLQYLTLGNISSESDILVGEKLYKKDMKLESATLYNRFKRLTAILKINLVDKTPDKTLTTKGFQAVNGWIGTGTDPYGKNEPELYKNNNFGGIAKIAMTGDNTYSMTKERCTGLKLKSDMSSRYFYDFKGRGNEKNMYISVLPTTLHAGDSFMLLLGNGDGDVIKKIIRLDRTMDIKACHIHEITIGINSSDIYKGNPFE